MHHISLKGLALVLAFVLGGFALGACSAVFVSEPIGDEAVALDPAQWQGTWTSGELLLMTTVLDAEAGLMQAAWLERGDKGAKAEIYQGHVRRTGDWLLIGMANPPPDGKAETAQSPAQPGETAVTEYLWARLVNDGRKALVWFPSPEAFRLAVAEGRIPGIVKQDNDVRLGDLTPEHLALINEPRSGLLSWEEPLVLIRIGD